ncbi:hypothetical protein [uncultured Sphingomonas sp.]
MTTITPAQRHPIFRGDAIGKAASVEDRQPPRDRACHDASRKRHERLGMA